MVIKPCDMLAIILYNFEHYNMCFVWLCYQNLKLIKKNYKVYNYIYI